MPFGACARACVRACNLNLESRNTYKRVTTNIKITDICMSFYNVVGAGDALYAPDSLRKCQNLDSNLMKCASCR